jgi:20S proteasome alpha/beta subunit
MTVDIAAICEKGNAIVAVSDMQRTFGRLFEVEVDSPKVFEFSDKCLVMHAGAGDKANQLCVYGKKQFGDATSTEKIAYGLKDVYKRFKAIEVNDNVLSRFGMDWDSFLRGQGGMNPQLITEIAQNLAKHDYEVELLVAGIDNEAHIYTISNPGVCSNLDKNGYWATGSGMQFAITTLAMGQYKTDLPLNSALYRLFEAKKSAEIAVGVGGKTDAYIITKGKGIKRVDEKVLQSLTDLYATKKDELGKIDRNLEERVSKINL